MGIILQTSRLHLELIKYFFYYLFFSPINLHEAIDVWHQTYTHQIKSTTTWRISIIKIQAWAPLLRSEYHSRDQFAKLNKSVLKLRETDISGYFFIPMWKFGLFLGSIALQLTTDYKELGLVLNVRHHTVVSNKG